MSDNLSKLFGVAPLNNTVELAVVEKDDNSVEEDANEVRNNLKVLLETSKTALEEALHLAKESESPRAYDVITSLIANMAAINGQIMDTHNKKADIKKKEKALLGESGTGGGQPAVVHNTQNNIAFVGTSAQLADHIESMSRNNDKGITDATVRD